MTFSVIIPTYKDWDRLKICINSLHESIDNGFNYEIIIVDNAKQHCPPEIFKHFSNVKLIHEPQPGSYAARNSGAKIASGEILAFTDSDCIPDKDWLVKSLYFFSANECDMIGGRVDIFKQKNGSNWAYIYEKNTAFPQKINVPKGYSVTANLFVKKKVFADLNGFNTSLKSGGDWEFTKRAIESGFSLQYAEDVVVNHPARNSIWAILKKQKRFAAWGYIKVKNKYRHSGIRILLSHLIHGIPHVFKRSKKVKSLKEKNIVFLISIGIYFTKTFTHLFILLRLINPDKIRE